MASAQRRRGTMTPELFRFVWVRWCNRLAFILKVQTSDAFFVFFYVCEVMAYAGLEHWNARGGSIQARPGKPTMRITPWLFAFVSIHSACVKLIKQSLVLPRWSLGKETASRRATYPTCSQVVCETDGKESNRDNDGERLYTSKWMHQDRVSAGVVYSECFYCLVTWIECKKKNDSQMCYFSWSHTSFDAFIP